MKGSHSRKRRKGGGRHPFGDEEHLVEIARLIETQKISAWSAACKVAPSAEGACPASIAARLHAKFLKDPALYRQKLQASHRSLITDGLAGVIEEHEVSLAKLGAKAAAALTQVAISISAGLSGALFPGSRHLVSRK